MNARFAFTALLVVCLLTACALSPTVSVIPTNTAQAQAVAVPTGLTTPTTPSVPTIAPTNADIPTSTATLAATPTRLPAQKPCSTDHPSLEFSAFLLKDAGVCLIYLPLRWYRGPGGYILQVPSSWTVRLAGAEGMNLMFNEDSQDNDRLPLFVQRIVITDTALDHLDSVAYGFELSPDEPVVKPSEQRLKKQIVTIGTSEGVNVLELETVDKDEEIRRYFLPFVDTDKCKGDCAVVYVFQTRFKHSERNLPQVEGFLRQLEDIVASIRFVIR